MNKLKFATVLCLVLFLNCSSLFAQTSLRERANEYFRGVDYTGITTGYLLNKGLFTDYQLSMFDTVTLESGKRLKREVLTDASAWRHLYKDLFHSYVKGSRRLPPLEDVDVLSEGRVSKSDFIPIGILNFKGNLMTQPEIDNNKANPARGIADKVSYREIRVQAATVLKTDKILPGIPVEFRLAREYYFTNTTENIEAIEIDFGDDKGIRSFTGLDATVDVIYAVPGEKVICVKIITALEKLVSYTTISVIPDYEKLHPADQEILISKMDGSYAGRTMTAPAGGKAQVYLGCDNVLDKTIIAIEGFDPNNERSAPFIFNNYMEPVRDALKAYGYDLIVLDFNNGGDYIQNNAEVVKQLIREVNKLKTGNYENTIIGASMGGLVARHALAQME